MLTDVNALVWVIVHAPTYTSTQLMKQFEANKFVSMMSNMRHWEWESGHVDPTPTITIESVEYCATCTSIIAGRLPRRDHSGEVYCSEACWQSAWR